MNKASITLMVGAGKDDLRKRLVQLGFQLPDFELSAAFMHARELIEKSGQANDLDMQKIASVISSPRYVLESFQMVATHDSCVRQATSTISLTVDGKKTVNDAAVSDGAVEAVFNAILDCAKLRSVVSLEDYHSHAIRGGLKSPAVVEVAISFGGDEVIRGYGVCNDVISASAKALVHALNRRELWS